MNSLRQCDFKQQCWYTFFMKVSKKTLDAKVIKVENNNVWVKAFDSKNNDAPYFYCLEGESIEWFKEWHNNN